MKVEIIAPSLLARQTGARIAGLLNEAVEARGTATFAISGGSRVGPLFETLAALPVPWERVHIFQVDERLAPDGHADRNWVTARSSLVDALPRPILGVHPMPVAVALDSDEAAEQAARSYVGDLRGVCGEPAILDVVHLGLGADGHTASLVPDDPVLAVDDRDVAVTGPYQGRRRMTLTYPALARARHLVWFVAGADKAAAVRRLVAADPTIPAGRLPSETATLFVDPDAADGLRRGTPRRTPG